MGKIDAIKAKLREKSAELRSAAEAAAAGERLARRGMKESHADGMVIGGLAAGAAAVGTVIVDKVLASMAGKWPSLARYRKYLDIAIGIMLILAGKVLGKKWAAMMIAGFVWVAIQVFAILVNKTGLASGFSVQGVDETEGISDVDLAVMGAVLAGMDDPEAYKVAEIVETGVIPLVLIPVAIELAQKYGPAAVDAIQRIVEKARKGHRKQGGKQNVLDARAIAQQHKATSAPLAITPGQEALSQSLMQNLQAELKKSLSDHSAEVQAMIAKSSATPEAAAGFLDRQARREERREDRREERREDRREERQADPSTAGMTEEQAILAVLQNAAQTM